MALNRVRAVARGDLSNCTRPDKRLIAANDGDETVTALIQALAAKSSHTGRHCGRVARYAAAMAAALDISEGRIKLMERCGWLHDIGKLGISEEVLEKPGALTSEEWFLLRLHPEVGIRMLQPLASLQCVLPAVAMHHERFDGTGYPYRLAGFDIPLEARVVSVCDAFDTMTSDRPYRTAIDPESAVTHLRAAAGTQFDPALVHAFAVEVLPGLGLELRRIADTARRSP